MRTLSLLLTLLACGSALAAGASSPQPPVAAGRLLELRRFESQVPITFRSVSGTVSVSEGFVAVIEVDPSLVAPVNQAERLLFFGDVAVRAVNRGDRSGRMVLLLPNADLTSTPLFFGPARPLRFVTAEALAADRQLLAGGLRTLPALESSWRVSDMNELYRRAAELVIRYAPQERDTAAMYLGARQQ